MKSQKIVNIASRGFILLSSFSFLSVSLMAFASPQAVMDLVEVQLNNTDAFSSIRGIYGGLGLAIVIALVYLFIKDAAKALLLLALIWGMYAVSRTITIFVEGALGDFGTQWLIIESMFFFISISLYTLKMKAEKQKLATQLV
jgi:hypothetical protein